VAVSGVAFAATALVVPRARPKSPPGPTDFPGAVLIGAGLLAILIPLEKAGEWGWGAPRTLVLLGAGVAFVAAWTRYELAARHPLVDLRLLRHRTVLSANVAAFTLGIGMYLSIVLISQYVQGPSAADGGFGFGATVFVSGLVLVPFSLTSYLASSAMPAVARRLGVRAIVPIGCLVMAVACLFFGLTGTSLWQAFVMQAVVGLGLGFTFAAMPQIIVSSVPPGETSSSLSFYQVTRYVGFSAGSSLSVTLLSAFSGGGDDLTRGAFRGSFLVATAIVLATAAVAWVATGAPRRAPGHDELAVEDGRLGAAGLPDLDPASARAAH